MNRKLFEIKDSITIMLMQQGIYITFNRDTINDHVHQAIYSEIDVSAIRLAINPNDRGF